MTRKAKIGISILAIVLVGPPALWIATKRKVPIEFIGKKPDFTFIFPEEFEGKPFIDWKGPGGMQITFPKKRKLAAGTTDPALAGYLDFTKTNSNLGWITQQLSIGSVSVPMQASFLPEPAPPGGPPRPAGVTALSSRVVIYPTVMGMEHPIYGVPYATDEAHREAVLDQGAKSPKYKVRLPVTHKFGPSIRRTEVIPAGPWTVTAKPRPWLLTTQDVSFDLTTDAPKGMMLLFRPTWKRSGANRWSYVQNQPFLLEGKPVELRTSRYQPNGKYEGSVVQLESFKVKVRAERGKNDLRLYLPNGQLLYYLGTAQGRGKHGLEMLDCRGKRLLFGGYYTMKTGEPCTFNNIRNGEVIDAVAYRARASFPVSGELDIPPPLSSPAQFTFSGGVRYHYYYVPPVP